MRSNLHPNTTELTTLLARVETRYCWNWGSATVKEPLRVIRRTMDIGVGEDLLDHERIADHVLLAEALTTTPAGSFKPRSRTY